METQEQPTAASVARGNDVAAQGNGHPGQGGTSSADQQTWEVVIGGLSGLVLGVLMSRLARVMGALAGGGILLLQLSRARGYAALDWERLQGDVLAAVTHLQQYLRLGWLGQVRQSVRVSFTTVTSFLGGFLLGFGLL